MIDADMISVVCIMDEDQYDELGKKIDAWSRSIEIIEEYKYELKHTGYFVLELSVMASYDIENLIRFLANHLEYYCMRVQCTNGIFCKCQGDIIDLKADVYSNLEAVDFVKDMLTCEERYNAIFDANSYFSKFEALELMLTHQDVVELDCVTPELFVEEAEFTVFSPYTGEVHNIDISIGIDPAKFYFIILHK